MMKYIFFDMLPHVTAVFKYDIHIYFYKKTAVTCGNMLKYVYFNMLYMLLQFFKIVYILFYKKTAATCGIVLKLYSKIE